MARRIANITLDNMGDLPGRCRTCVFWELDPVRGERAVAAGRSGAEKESWLSALLLDWGSCGKLAYVDDQPAGFVLYAPPAYVPRGVAFPTSPVAADAVLLMNAFVGPDFAGGGLGRTLIQSMAKDLVRRGIRAVEAFGDAGTDHRCVAPADFYLAVGFKTVRSHARFPRLRLELRNMLSWREDMEVAIERLLGSMQPDPIFRPV
jgi:GNAT superfamily N-acetyltransferase